MMRSAVTHRSVAVSEGGVKILFNVFTRILYMINFFST